MRRGKHWSSRIWAASPRRTAHRRFRDRNFHRYVFVAGSTAGIAAGFSGRGWRGDWLDIIFGLLCVLLGVLVLFAPFAGALSLVWMIGAWFLIIGMLEIATATRSLHHRGWFQTLGTLDVVIGLALLLAGPISALIVLAVMVGVSFRVRGTFFLAALALGLRRAGNLSALRR
ncbi:DUF308 domain-containing protein [Sphingobium sp. H39-3-25]|uniref:HdeD family acid-resistance protein n=1 Tax=Sphingobium arseniciresistens TaxID=3030834 RepID=UPI0023B8F6BF|nr:DUF308 domain-containing protein [Sphingobium arseniciresistens]